MSIVDGKISQYLFEKHIVDMTSPMQQEAKCVEK